MKIQAGCVLVALLCVSVGIASNAVAAEAFVPKTPRGELVQKVVRKWAPHVQEAYKLDPSRWAREMAPTFAKVPLDKLRTASSALTFTAMNDALLAAKAGVVPKALGDIAADLVFVPVQPCRILDTRLAGGAITGNTTRNFDVTAVSNYSFQGGSADDCGGVGAAGSFAAVAINFTVVNPVANGYITAYPFLGTQPLASTLNYKAGDILANFAIVRLDQGASANEMTVYAANTLNLVGDVVGYYIAPQNTGLECVNTPLVSAAVAPGAVANVGASACPAGYTQTATNCESSSFQMTFAYSNGGVCSALNNAAASANLRASRTCCRVPGRL